MRKLLGYVGGVLALIVVWQLLAWAIDSPALPGPVTAFAEFFDLPR